MHNALIIAFISTHYYNYWIKSCNSRLSTLFPSNPINTYTKYCKYEFCSQDQPYHIFISINRILFLLNFLHWSFNKMNKLNNCFVFLNQAHHLNISVKIFNIYISSRTAVREIKRKLFTFTDILSHLPGPALVNGKTFDKSFLQHINGLSICSFSDDIL